MCIHTCTKYKTPPVPLCTVPQTQVPTYSLAHRDHGETKDKSNRTTSLIRLQPRRLFLGPDSLTHASAYVVSAPNSSYRLPIGYLDIAFNVRFPAFLQRTLLGSEVNILLVGYF